mmetsp:Transcript_1639/g.3336  ORF Transcript_1639/g.3336 Transcript_1639/m.3336 type:complete len:333 (+) Transcript_1639:282-1280(+)
MRLDEDGGRDLLLRPRGALFGLALGGLHLHCGRLGLFLGRCGRRRLLLRRGHCLRGSRLGRGISSSCFWSRLNSRRLCGRHRRGGCCGYRGADGRVLLVGIALRRPAPLAAGPWTLTLLRSRGNPALKLSLRLLHEAARALPEGPQSALEVLHNLLSLLLSFLDFLLKLLHFLLDDLLGSTAALFARNGLLELPDVLACHHRIVTGLHLLPKAAHEVQRSLVEHRFHSITRADVEFLHLLHHQVDGLVEGFVLLAEGGPLRLEILQHLLEVVMAPGEALAHLLQLRLALTGELLLEGLPAETSSCLLGLHRCHARGDRRAEEGARLLASKIA